MFKQLIATVILLLIQNVPEIIYYTYGIFDFTMLANYLSHDNETIFYMDYALYKLDKTKIEFENYCPIDIKLF